jgi:MFS family permease
MQSAALPYVAYSLTHRYGGVGLNGFFQYVPIMLMGAYGGAMADRVDRKAMLIATQLVQAAFAVALWALVASGTESMWSISLLSFGSGLAGGLNIPVWQAFVSQLVPRESLTNAIALNSTQFNAARALGTFFAGLVIWWWGVAAVFAINALSYVAVLVGLSAIESRGVPDRTEGRRTVLGDLRAGVAYVMTQPAIKSCCVAIAAVAFIASPLFSFVTASYGRTIFGLGGWRQGLLWGSGGIGAVLFSPLVLIRGTALRRERLLIISMSVHAAGVIIVGLSPNWLLACAGLVLYGGSYLGMAAALNTTIQMTAREDMRGKSIAVYVICLTGALPLGLVAWGWAADQWGVRGVTVAAGCALATIAAAFAASGRLSSMA